MSASVRSLMLHESLDLGDEAGGLAEVLGRCTALTQLEVHGVGDAAVCEMVEALPGEERGGSRRRERG